MTFDVFVTHLTFKISVQYFFKRQTFYRLYIECKYYNCIFFLGTIFSLLVIYLFLSIYLFYIPLQVIPFSFCIVEKQFRESLG